MSLTDAQLAVHTINIGGSVAAAAIGIDPNLSPLLLYRRMKGITPKEDLSDIKPVIFGNLFEPVIADYVAKKLKVRLRNVYITKQHKDHDFMVAHPDRLISGRKEGLEIKNRSLWQTRKYGEEYTDEIMPVELVQCAHYMAVMNYDRWHLAVCLGGQDIKIFTIERDNELEKRIIERESIFWSCIQDNREPEPLSLSDIKEVYKTDDASSMVSTDKVQVSVSRLKSIKNQRKSLKEQEEKELLFIQKEMGSSSILLDGENLELCTWKTQQSTRLDVKRLKEERSDIFEDYSMVSGSRVFRIK